MKDIMKTFVFGLILAVFMAVLGNNPCIKAQTSQTKYDKNDLAHIRKQRKDGVR